MLPVNNNRSRLMVQLARKQFEIFDVNQNNPPPNIPEFCDGTINSEQWQRQETGSMVVESTNQISDDLIFILNNEPADVLDIFQTYELTELKSAFHGEVVDDNGMKNDEVEYDELEYDNNQDPDYQPQENEAISDSEEEISRKEFRNSNKTCTDDSNLVIFENSCESIEGPHTTISPATNSSHENESRQLKRSRKRVRKPENWKCNMRKERKLSGREYISKKRSMIQEKSIKPPCRSSCKKLCSEKIDSAARLNIFKGFWRKEYSNDMKRLFVASNVVCENVKRRNTVQNVENQSNRPRTVKKNGTILNEDTKQQYRRKNTLQYFFEINGEKVHVCKTFFLNTLCISEMFVKTALAKKGPGGIITPDKRGKKEPPNKLDEEIRESIRSHISSFPIIESHYSRERSSRSYLGNHLNISKMYKMYTEKCLENKTTVAKEWLYNEIFNHEFNLGFKEPSNDTCDECDEFNCKLRNDSLPEQERSELKSEYEAHLAEANRRYREKQDDKERSKKPGSKEKLIMFDLQKCLPTPHLSNSSTFYLRKLWTYNLTILDVTENKAYCCMWDETIGDRGSQEMSSCLLVWALDNLSDTETLTLWTDNCGGQNRNFPMIASYFWLLRVIPALKYINHKFLLKGHTHMEVDGVHSVIERAKKRIGPDETIAIPWDWQQFVRRCKFKEIIHVYNMEMQDFKNFSILFKGSSAPLVKRITNTINEKFLISQVIHFRIESDKLGYFYYKTTADENFSEIDFTRRTRGAVWPEELPPLRTDLKPISVEKYRDIQKLMRWVPSSFHGFYRNIPQKGMEEDEKQEENQDFLIA